ncbi:MAG: phosphoribosyltransferase [bacterium]
MINDSIGQTVLKEEEINCRVADLADEMAGELTEGAVLVGVLRGAAVFAVDLLRRLPRKVRLDFLEVSRAGPTAALSGIMRLRKDISVDVTDRQVILIEDTVDSGATLLKLKQHLLDKGAAEVKVCVLIDKAENCNQKCEPDYVGFRLSGLEGRWNYVVGYGMDFNEDYRNLPYIGVLKEGLWAPLK